MKAYFFFVDTDKPDKMGDLEDMPAWARALTEKVDRLGTELAQTRTELAQTRTDLRYLDWSVARASALKYESNASLNADLRSLSSLCRRVASNIDNSFPAANEAFRTLPSIEGISAELSTFEERVRTYASTTNSRLTSIEHRLAALEPHRPWP